MYLILYAFLCTFYYKFEHTYIRIYNSHICFRYTFSLFIAIENTKEPNQQTKYY